ncbi:transporter substrate-binding domain-containing protein [Oryzibacter oryziterrae]|uniref:transporter substrate-binding domain-containing protein n=1 Tax=Oryzibacter oryziterrae TaxID=2766474 RepID=UPI001F3EFF36|nr:transporter substrate-binding domain-containing protein [Oryzibacter oryziterrae]
MKLSQIFFAGALSLAAIVTPAAAKEWKTVTIAMEGGYAPWNLTNADGTLGGFEPELAKHLCELAKVECKLIALDWDGMITALNAGKYDVMMDAVSITDERKQVIDFTVPYAATPAIFAAVKDGGFDKLPGTGTVIKLDSSKADPAALEPLRKALAGKTIGVQTATTFANFLYDNFKDVATIQEYKTSAERDLDLAAGRIDVGFDDETYFNAAFESADNATLTLSGPSIGGKVWGEGMGLGIRKTDPELKALLDEAIKAAIADGTVKTLALKWFKADVSP